MIYFFKELDEMGKKLGYPFYVFRDGKCSKSAVSLDGKDIYIMEINEPFESCEILSFDKEIKNDDFCFWNIEGKSVDELLHRRDDIQPWHGVFLTQNEKKELFENGNGEALKLILDKFSLSDCFSEILFIPYSFHFGIKLFRSRNITFYLFFLFHAYRYPLY